MDKIEAGHKEKENGEPALSPNTYTNTFSWLLLWYGKSIDYVVTVREMRISFTLLWCA